MERRRRLGAALTCLEAECWRGAHAECTALLARHPDDLEGLLLLGLTMAAMGDVDDAASVLNRVAAARPECAHPCNDLAGMRPAVPAANVIAQFHACLKLAPDDARLRRDFGAFLLDNGMPADAIDVLRPDTASASGRNLMGMALVECGRFAEAVPRFRAAIALDPVPSVGWSNLGLALKVEGQSDDAIAAYDAALARSPNDVTMHINRAVALLHAGRWREAWPEYEWRLLQRGHTMLPMDRLLPDLATLGDLSGKVILVTHEEGFGDTMNFMRYVPLLAARGAAVHIWVPAPLVRLARTLQGVARILTGDVPQPEYDWHCPFQSLPRVFASTPETVPAEPYLAAEPALVAQWRALLPPDGLRVGLVWAGQARPWVPGFATLDGQRSMDLDRLLPLARIDGVRLVSLQSGTPGGQAASPPSGMALTDPMPDVTDFADTAAIIANLDVVVSVDTAVVHLAGAMGKRVLLLDRYDNCWRWLSGRQDSPWYPGLTILRQTRPGDWSGPVAEAAAILRTMCGAKPPLVAA